jgi:N-dimethylarginine dimethylaminohydrolase
MANRVMLPSQLDTPAFMMNFPYTVDNRAANNPLMKETEGEPYDYEKAFSQWRDLYQALTADDALVMVMPDYGQDDLQDLPFVANIGAYLPHDGTVALSNFKSRPRRGEEKVGAAFFEGLGYRIAQSPHFWEGEADLKYLHGNLYAGGCGIRTDAKTYDWMAEELGCNVIPVRMTDEKLYHFDCSFFPITGEAALASVSVFDPADVKKLEAVLDLIPVPKDCVYDGWTNGVRLNDKILVDIPRDEAGQEKADSRKRLERTIEVMGFKPVLVDLSEFRKSGADLSCLIFHFNFHNRD